MFKRIKEAMSVFDSTKNEEDSEVELLQLKELITRTYYDIQKEMARTENKIAMSFGDCEDWYNYKKGLEYIFTHPLFVKDNMITETNPNLNQDKSLDKERK